MSVTPAFWLSQVCWLEQGGICAVANIRGGGEYGEEWHRAAVCERKQTSVDDLVAGATFLIEQCYTCPGRLALMGMSNGGLKATFITTAENDLRVVPAHAMKFAAALQSANAGTHPILLCIDHDGGHGVGIPIQQRIDALSKILSFLLQSLSPKEEAER